ncbi:HTH-type transcriptional regulator NimR [Xylophilus ampelinus]|nr:HTH-type transcriptional regulator NimR [Xylophilus ampelinus]
MSTIARSQTFFAYQTIPRPVSMIVVEHDPEPSLIVPAHSHPRAQLAYAVKGTFTLHTADGAWLVPPNRAVWVPGGIEHEMHARGQPVSNRSLYIQPEASPDLPTECCVIEVSPLMRQLIIEAIDIPLLYDEAGRDGRVMRLILDEICAAPRVPLHVPMPRDARLLRICRALLEDPGREGDLEHWARHGALGRRTLTRLFREETGITFTLWRQQLRLMEALRQLSQGTSVTTVAYDLGYESPSAFTAMFRRVMGKTPKHYLGRSDIE